MSKQRPTFLSYRCDECGKYPIQKYRWECNVCEDFDMCTACYEGGVHDKSHDCTQHVIQTRKVVPTATRASLSGSSKSKQKPKASDKPKPKAKAKDASASSASAQPGTGKAQQVRNLYDSLGLSRRKIGTNRLELFLSLYNAALEKWPKTQSAPITVRRHFLYITELLLNYQASVPVEEDGGSGNALEETYEMGLQLLTCAHAQITMWESDRLGWFGAPVPASVPNYHDLIKEPSDLGTIHMLLGKKKLLKRLPGGNVKALEALFKEYCHRIELIWKNAYAYNPDDHPVFLSAKRLCQAVSTEEGFLNFWSEVPENFKFPVCTEADSTGKVKRVAKKRGRPKGSKLKKRKSVAAKNVSQKSKVAKLQDQESVGATARKSKLSSNDSEHLTNGHESGNEAPKTSGQDGDNAIGIAEVEEEVSSLDKGIKALHAKLDQWFKFVDNFRLVY